MATVADFEIASAVVAKNQGLEEVLQQLDDNNVSSETMEISQANESSLFDVEGACQIKSATLAALRKGTVEIIRASLRMIGVSFAQAGTIQSRALLLLDAYCLRQPSLLACASSFGALCMSVVRLVCKVEDRQLDVKRIAEQELGFPFISKVSAADLDIHEESVLVTMRWKVMFTTLEEWTEAMWKRLDIITIGSFRPYLEPLLEFTSYVCAVLVTSFPSCPEFMPFNVAQGVVSLSMIASGLIPAGALRLSDLTDPFQQLSRECPKFVRGNCQETMLLLASLFEACCAKPFQLQENSQLVNAKLKLCRPRIVRTANI